jgi:hypothetical protein
VDSASPGILRPGSEFLGAARVVLAAERARLADLLAGDHELVLVGGSSLPTALTKGDVDLHLRVPAADFGRTVAALRGVYPVVHPEIWQESLATFAVPAALPAGVAVTPAGSEHDVRFTRSWQLLAADPRLVEAYNAVKLRFWGRPAEYERHKSLFFDGLLGGAQL